MPLSLSGKQVSTPVSDRAATFRAPLELTRGMLAGIFLGYKFLRSISPKDIHESSPMDGVTSHDDTNATLQVFPLLFFLLFFLFLFCRVDLGVEGCNN